MINKVREIGADLLDTILNNIMRIGLFCICMVILIILIVNYENYSSTVGDLATQIDNQEIKLEAARYIMDSLADKMFLNAAVLIGMLILCGALLIMAQISVASERVQNIDLRLWEIERMMRLNYLEQKNSDLRQQIDDLTEVVDQKRRELHDLRRDEDQDDESGEPHDFSTK